MIKKSTSLHKIPYFDLASQALLSVDKDKEQYHDVMCVCPPSAYGANCAIEGRPEQAGYKFQFNYSIQPTMEPISYKLKGYKQNASLTYNNIGEDITTDVIEEVSTYMKYIQDVHFLENVDVAAKAIVDNFQEYDQNTHDNWALSNKIFQKMKRFEQKGEEYSPSTDLPRVCMGVNIESSTYIVTSKFSIINWHNG